MRIGPETRALVTGASRGIGRALAVVLAGRGATLGLAARSASELEQLAGALGGTGQHVPLPCDVTDVDALSEAVTRFRTLANGLDLVVANAGIAHYGPFATTPFERARAMTEVNWVGTLNLVSAALPHLLEQGSGQIVIVSSGAGIRSFPSAAVYGATKAAQRGFGEALRHELAGTGVGVTLVYPGEIATALHDHEKATMPAWYRGGPDAVPAEKLAERIVAGVEADARAVYYPGLVRVLRVVHGLSPRLGDRFLRALRGPTAAQRLD